MMDHLSIKKKAALISLFVGLGMFTAKMGAYFITGSAAIFSDAAESVVHVLATAMALYSIILASKPADDTHLYGHGNIEFFSAGIEGALIILAALFIIFEAVKDIIAGPELQQLDTGVIIISSAGVINLFLGLYLIKTGRNTNSLTLVADGKHVLTDSYTSLGVIVGIILVLITGYTLFDPLFAIAVAVNILFTGYKLVRSSVGGLMHETDTEVLNALVSKLSEIKKSYWIDIHELRFWQSGDKLFIDFHLILPHFFTIRETHSEENEIEAALTGEFPGAQIKIHFDYCIPDLCCYCFYENCEARTTAGTRHFVWDVDKMTGPPVYKKDIINGSKKPPF